MMIGTWHRASERVEQAEMQRFQDGSETWMGQMHLNGK